MHPTLPTPSVLIQLLDTGAGRPKWLEADTRNYAHLLATVPRHPALLAVKATLPELCAYSATFAPPDALEELTAYLLSWAASAAPFQPLTAAQLQRAAASDEGAHRVAKLLLQRGLPADTARVALLEGLCSSLTRRARRPPGQQCLPPPTLHHAPTLTGHLAWEATTVAPVNSRPRRSTRPGVGQIGLGQAYCCQPHAHQWPVSPRRAHLPVMPAPPMSVVSGQRTGYPAVHFSLLGLGVACGSVSMRDGA